METSTTGSPYCCPGLPHPDQDFLRAVLGSFYTGLFLPCSPFTGIWPALSLKSTHGLFPLALSHFILHRQLPLPCLNPTDLGICFSKDQKGLKLVREKVSKKNCSYALRRLLCHVKLSLHQHLFRQLSIKSLKHRTGITLLGFRKFPLAVSKVSFGRPRSRRQGSNYQVFRAQRKYGESTELCLCRYWDKFRMSVCKIWRYRLWERRREHQR